MLICSRPCSDSSPSGGKPDSRLASSARQANLVVLPRCRETRGLTRERPSPLLPSEDKVVWRPSRRGSYGRGNEQAAGLPATEQKGNVPMSTISMSTNWLEDIHSHADETARPMAMPVFAGKKLVVVEGSSGMGRQTAADVVAAGGSAVIIGEDRAKVDDTVQTLAEDGSAHGITADLTDRKQVETVCEQLADEHADATLLVNAAGFFIPKTFLDYDGPSYDSYLELDRAI